MVGGGYEPATFPDSEIALLDRIMLLGVYPGVPGVAPNERIIASKGTFQLRPDSAAGLGARGGRLKSFSVQNVGSSWTVDIYDSNGDESAENKVIEYVSADGKVNWNWSKDGLVFENGIRVVSGGTTAGRLVMEWG